jgi:hypothetical protein
MEFIHSQDEQNRNLCGQSGVGIQSYEGITCPFCLAKIGQIPLPTREQLEEGLDMAMDNLLR